MNPLGAKNPVQLFPSCIGEFLASPREGLFLVIVHIFRVLDTSIKTMIWKFGINLEKSKKHAR